MPQELTRRVRAYVINNQIASNRFNCEEEDSFMKKLSDDVRQCILFSISEVSTFNRVQLVKKSMFFLCNWTKRFRNLIATKLERIVISPDEPLSQIRGKEKLYLLFRGKVDVETNFESDYHSKPRKHLATIEIDPQKEVYFNVYGYTAVVSGLKVNLRAVARDYSICFCVDREGLREAMLNSQ